jgi:hypothetical protein
MSRERSVFCAVVGVAATAVLAGCSLLPSVHNTTAPETTTSPTVGLCWNASVTHANNWSDWEGGDAVPCSDSHTLYTYQVGKISGESVGSWASPNDPSSLRDAVQTKADAACSISTLLPHQKWNQQLIDDFFFVPTEAQWKAGARWVRCDVGVLATGTTLDNESFTALPSKISTLVTSVSSDPVRYEFCMNSTESVTDVGPLDNTQATIADCSASPQWTLAAHGNLPEAAGAPFPSQAAANTESTAICSPSVSGDGQVWVAYLPTKTGWASGDREVDCWVGQKELVGGQTA